MELAAAFDKRGLVWYLPSHRKGLRRLPISLSPFSISTPRRGGSRCARGSPTTSFRRPEAARPRRTTWR